MRDWWKRMSSKRMQVTAGGIIAMLFIFILLNTQYKIFGNDLGKAVFAFGTVTMVYLASSIVSKLALAAKLEKYKITHPQLSPKMTRGRIVITLAISVAFGIAAGVLEYISPETVDYTDINYAMMSVVIAAVPVASVIRSWFDY